LDIRLNQNQNGEGQIPPNELSNGTYKLCFIKKGSDEQVQIINPISTSGDQSVINSGQDK